MNVSLFWSRSGTHPILPISLKLKSVFHLFHGICDGCKRRSGALGDICQLSLPFLYVMRSALCWICTVGRWYWFGCHTFTAEWSMCAFCRFFIFAAMCSAAMASLVLHCLKVRIGAVKAFEDNRFPQILSAASPVSKYFLMCLSRLLSITPGAAYWIGFVQRRYSWKNKLHACLFIRLLQNFVQASAPSVEIYLVPICTVVQTICVAKINLISVWLKMTVSTLASNQASFEFPFTLFLGTCRHLHSHHPLLSEA